MSNDDDLSTRKIAVVFVFYTSAVMDPDGMLAIFTRDEQYVDGMCSKTSCDIKISTFSNVCKRCYASQLGRFHILPCVSHITRYCIPGTMNVSFENQNFDFSACANNPMADGSVDIMTLLHHRKKLTPEEGSKDIHSDPYKLLLTLMITSLLRVGLNL